MGGRNVAIICYGLGPSEGTWVLSITHGTWRGFLAGKKATDILKIVATRIDEKRSRRVVEK